VTTWRYGVGCSCSDPTDVRDGVFWNQRTTGYISEMKSAVDRKRERHRRLCPHRARRSHATMWGRGHPSTPIKISDAFPVPHGHSLEDGKVRHVPALRKSGPNPCRVEKCDSGGVSRMRASFGAFEGLLPRHCSIWRGWRKRSASVRERKPCSTRGEEETGDTDTVRPVGPRKGAIVAIGRGEDAILQGFGVVLDEMSSCRSVP